MVMRSYMFDDECATGVTQIQENAMSDVAGSAGGRLDDEDDKRKKK